MKSQPLRGRSLRGDLEDHAAAADAGAKGTAIAAEVCSAVEISRRISDQTRYGSCAVRSAGEAVQHGLLAGLIQLEHRSAATPEAGDTATILRRTVEISRRVRDHACDGQAPVRSAGEAVQHRLAADRTQLEHCSIEEEAASLSGAVEIARLVHDQAADGIQPVPAAIESV